jgi:predicted DNA-binding protein (MmcQ/YjbR family)
MDLSDRVTDLKAILDALPGATIVARGPPRSTKGPTALDYQVMGKTFAILAIRGARFVVLKCDPHLIEILKEQYAGVGHRTHLDRRHWIAVFFDADVPEAEVERLARHSYDLVRAGLTKKQQAELAGSG